MSVREVLINDKSQPTGMDIDLFILKEQNISWPFSFACFLNLLLFLRNYDWFLKRPQGILLM